MDLQRNGTVVINKLAVGLLLLSLGGCGCFQRCPDKQPVVLKPPKAPLVVRPMLSTETVSIATDGPAVYVKALESDLTRLGAYSYELENVIKGYEKYTGD